MRLFFALSFAATALIARANEQVLLVVNADSWASTYIANEYVQLRKIPAANVVRLRGLSSFERMGVAEFREKILLPALRAAEERGLANQLDYVLYSADFPTAIDVSEDMAGQKFPQAITQPASLTGLTYFYRMALAKSPTYLGLNANFYHRSRAQVTAEAPWPEADQRRYAELLGAIQKLTREREANPAATPDPAVLRPILDGLVSLKAAHPKNTELLYNEACLRALLGEPAAAVETLREAIRQGWWDMRHAESDPDLLSVRTRPDFQALKDLAKDVKFEHAPASGFRGAVGWQPGGRLVPPDKGARYLLSTLLAHTSGRGNSVTEALASLRRSVKADGSRPSGTIYYLENEDRRSKPREWGFAPAVQKLRELGVTAKVEQGTLPSKKPDVMGLTAGVENFSWPASGSTILPGAICEHLTSFGGVMEETGSQTPLSEFIRYGAAGASGTVTEPYAIQAKFPSPFIHWFYAQGCTLAESFYQSIAGPYQLLIVGDALCAPWRRPYEVQVDGLTANLVIKGTVVMRPRLAKPAGGTAGSLELYVDGRRITAGKPGDALAIDTTRFADGVHTLSVVVNVNDAVAPRARLTVPMAFKNREAGIRANVASETWPWDRPIKVDVNAPGAAAVVLRLGAEEVGRVTGASGTITVNPAVLGQGPVQLQPVAIAKDGAEHWGEPMVGKIVPPAPLPAADPKGALERGFRVTPKDGTPAVVTWANDDWLTKAGVKADGEFVAEGWFPVPTQDVYQFQWRGAAELKITVDGQTLTWVPGQTWNFLPVHLAAGHHRFRIEGKTAGAAKVDLRFGGPGARRLDGDRFFHVK